MRRFVLSAAAGLCLAPLSGLAHGSELVMPPVRAPAQADKPAKPISLPLPDTKDGGCSSHGTSVEFFDTPSAAATRARKEQKLVYVLHVSGNFENPRFTWNNAEALRVNALASPEVGKYLNEHFCCSFQKVATFRIVGNQKQGGNVASYFCAPDGRVLHAVAGPVDSRTMLREAKWVIETAEAALKDAREDGAAFKAYFRKAHVARLRNEHGLVVEAVTYDPPFEQDPNSALTYNDPSGRPLAPRLPPPPVDGPDVTFREAQKKEAAAPGARALADRRGRPWVLGNQGRVHMLMASHCMVKIEKVYGTIFQDILGERISTKPVEVATPFPWLVRPNR